jgi:hypothetical protein
VKHLEEKIELLEAETSDLATELIKVKPEIRCPEVMPHDAKANRTVAALTKLLHSSNGHNMICRRTVQSQGIDFTKLHFGQNNWIIIILKQISTHKTKDKNLFDSNLGF